MSMWTRPFSRRHVLCAAAITTAFACDNVQGPDKDAPDEDDEAVYSAETPSYDCDEQPSARIFAQMAGFHADTPIEVAQTEADVLYPSMTLESTRPVERGFLLYGGLDTDAFAPLNDLWLFDITNEPSLACPWVKISDEANPRGAVYGASLTFRPTDESLFLVGGHLSDGVNTATSADIAVIDLDSLEDGFVDWGVDLPDVQQRHQMRGDARCDSEPQVSCWYVQDTERCYDSESTTEGPCDNSLHIQDFQDIQDPCDPVSICAGTDTYDADGNRLRYLTDNNNSWYSGCADDPVCNDGELDETVSGTGLAEHAAVYIPPTYPGMGDKIYVHGGTTGCEGTNCSDWDELWPAWQEVGESGSIANNQDIFVIDLVTGTVTRESPDTSAFQSTDQAFGFRGAAGSPGGLNWQAEDRSWAASAAGWSSILVGGSLSQSVIPSTEMSLLEESTRYWSCKHEQRRGPALTGSEWIDADIYDDVDGMTAQATIGASIAPGGSAYKAKSHGLSSKLFLPAMTHIGNGAHLVVGGITESGLPNGNVRRIVPDDPSETALVSSVSPRYAGNVVWDPVGEKAYVFGGTTDERLYVLSTGGPNKSAEWTMSGTAVTVTQETADDWSQEVSYLLTNNCSGDGCHSSQLWIHLTNTNDTDVANEAVVQVTYEDGYTAQLQVVSHPSTLTEGGVGITSAHQLPRYLLDGESVWVDVWYVSSPRDDSYSYRESYESNGFSTYTVGDDDRRGWVMQHPAIPSANGQLAESMHDVTIHTSINVLDAATMPFAVGEPAAPGAQQSNTFFNEVPVGVNQYVAGAQEDLALVTATSTSGLGVAGPITTTVYAYADPSMPVSVDLEAYLSGASSGRTLDDDIQAVADRLGPYHSSTLHLLFHPPKDEELDGSYRGGVIHVQAFETDGTADGSAGIFAAQSVVAHELSHDWLGGSVHFDFDAEWFMEALPTLVAQSLYPESDTHPLDNFEARVENTLYAEDCSLEDGHDKYLSGVYVLGQHHHVAMATLGGLSSSAWARWPARLQAARRNTIGSSTVEGWLNADAPGYFYEEWVQGCPGVPILAIREVAFTPDSSRAITDPDAWHAGHGRLVIEQAQTEQFGWKTFTSGVPYALHCPEVAHSSGTSLFNQCTVLKSDFTYPDISPTIHRPSLLTQQRQHLPLTFRSTSLSRVPFPAKFTLYQGAGLVPEAASYAWSNAVWCGDVSSGACNTDIDTDGYPTFTDCDDKDAAVNPGTAEGLSLTDDDCNCYRSDGLEVQFDDDAKHCNLR
jgi:hypothetical protein